MHVPDMISSARLHARPGSARTARATHGARTARVAQAAFTRGTTGFARTTRTARAGLATCVAWAAFALFAAPVLPGFAATLHVSPKGNDKADGTQAHPFASLERARDAVRDLRRGGSLRSDEAVTVLLHDGLFAREKPFVLSPEDSGTPNCPVVYTAAPGARPVIDGGRRITGWRRHDDRLWVADLPEVRSGAWRFRQLYVDGRLQRRARIPNEGFLRVAACPEGTPKKVNYHTDCLTFVFAPGDLRADWRNLQDVEVIVYHFWTDSHLPIASIDTATNLVTFAHRAGKTFTDDFSEDGARYIVENVFEGLDQPGEWYLDRPAGRLYYQPRPGEDPNRLEIVAPVAPALLRLEGDLKGSRFVSHVAFSGIAFAHTHFDLPKGNSNDKQGSASVTAAVTLRAARDIRFERNVFSLLGGWAVDLMAGCRGITLSRNALRDLGAGGFRVDGGTAANPPWERTEENTIADNVVERYGREWPSACGILLMNTAGNRVLHNRIADGYYTGISVGWVWGYQRSVARDNRIEGNHIHDIGHGLLSDMGGIYTLGPAPGTVLRGNRIHDVDANHYGGWGIYHDEGSSSLLVENNVVYRTKFAPFNIHFAKEVVVRNNIFALGRIDQLSRGRAEPHKSVFFEGNIIYWREGELLSKNWKDVPYEFHFHPKDKKGKRTVNETFDFDWNLYFNPSRPLPEIKFADGNWEAWRKRGKDVHSLFADPKFADPDKGDFRLPPDSPAFRIGFRPFPLDQAGPRPETAR